MISDEDRAKNTKAFFEIFKEISSLEQKTESIRLIQEGIDLHYTDEAGNTALHIVAEDSFDPTVVELLLNAGAKTNVKNNHGNTPLHISMLNYCDEGDKKDWSLVPELLINRGCQAEFNIQNNLGNTPLHLAAKNAHMADMVKLLIEKGADPNIKNAENETPLHYSMHSSLRWNEINVKSINEKIKHLLNNGADINAQDSQGDTLLNKVASKGYESTIQLLLDNNAKIDIPSNDGNTPLKIFLGTMSPRFIDKPTKLFFLTVLNKIKNADHLNCLVGAFNVILKEDWSTLFGLPESEKMLIKIWSIRDIEKQNKIIELIQQQYDNAIVLEPTRKYVDPVLLDQLLNKIRYSPAITEIERMHLVSQTLIFGEVSDDARYLAASSSTSQATVDDVEKMMDTTLHLSHP